MPDHTPPGFLDQEPGVIAADDEQQPAGVERVGTVGVEQIRHAQEIYRSIFELIGDETWCQAPKGPLAHHWQRLDGARSTNYVTRLAFRIHQFAPNAYPGLIRSYQRKLKTLFRPPDPNAYEETLVELEIGSALSELISPIELEPLVPLEKKNSSNPPKSPDYGLWLPETRVTIEVTVWHWGAFAAWGRMYDQIHDTLMGRLLKPGVRRQLRIELPIGSPQAAIGLLSNRNLCAQIRESDWGERVFAQDTDTPITIAWSPALHFEDPANVDMDAVRATRVGPELHWTDGVDNIESYVAISGSACITDDRALTALPSLRRALDEKKAQRDPNRPHFLAIALNSPRAGWDVFGPLIEGRIWPNRVYDWLSGILEWSPDRTIGPSTTHGSFLGYNPNPNAAVPAPESMMRLMSGQEQFHTMWKRLKPAGPG